MDVYRAGYLINVVVTWGMDYRLGVGKSIDYGVVRITKVKLEWRPEYTELTDAALVSNAVNVNFNSAVDPTNVNSPANVDEVTQYQSCKSTGITRPHKRTFVPSILMGGVTPCNCSISTQSPSERHYAIKYGIPPTGVAMTFRCVATYYLECSTS